MKVSLGRDALLGGVECRALPLKAAVVLSNYRHAAAVSVKLPFMRPCLSHPPQTPARSRNSRPPPPTLPGLIARPRSAKLGAAAIPRMFISCHCPSAHTTLPRGPAFSLSPPSPSRGPVTLHSAKRDNKGAPKRRATLCSVAPPGAIKASNRPANAQSLRKKTRFHVK